MPLGQPRGLIVTLPDAPIDDYVGVIEVLIQMGLPTFTLPVGTEAFTGVAAVFGARARFGMSAVTTAGDVAHAAEAGASFLLADTADKAVDAAAEAHGLPCCLAAMTPTEVRGVLKSAGVYALLYPADVVGPTMAARLASIGLIDRVIPSGGVGAYAAGEWFAAGAPAVCIDITLLGDVFEGGSLSKLRDRCTSFVSAHNRALGSSAE